MTILALEFSSMRRSVALARADGEVLAEAVAQTSGRGTDAFGLIERVLKETEISRDAVEVIAVGLGPGSYTGIRAAIAVAQGWQLARGVKVLGVSSIEALAIQAQKEGIVGTVDLVVDAQRGEFYMARWEISNAERREVTPLKIVSGMDFAAHKNSGSICTGPEMERKLFPCASAVARLAAGRSDYMTDKQLEPIYLRETSFVRAPTARTV